MHGAAQRGQRHGNRDEATFCDIDSIDQAEIDDVDTQFRVIISSRFKAKEKNNHGRVR